MEAGRLDPTALRIPGALHLAAALDPGDDIDGPVMYDDRLAEAAHGWPGDQPRRVPGDISDQAPSSWRGRLVFGGRLFS